MATANPKSRQWRLPLYAFAFKDLDLSGDLAVAGNTVLTGTTTHTGAVTNTGGQVSASSAGYRTWQAVAATSGTDTAFADGTTFLASVFIPHNKTLTGIGFLLGSVGGTDKVIVRLYSAAGALLASSTTAASGTTAGTAANTQEIAFTATYAAIGPGTYWIAVSANGATAKLRTVPAFTGGGMFAGSVALTHAAVTAITSPVTFTADKGPVAYVY